MSRKSKATIQRERLKAISECPADIFSVIEADDVLFDKIAAAERGDTDAIKDTSLLLFSKYIHGAHINHAMLYFLKKGVDFSIAESAKHLIICADMTNECLDCVDKAIEVLRKSGSPLPEDYTNNALFKSIIYSANEAADYAELLNRITLLDNAKGPYAELYFLYKTKQSSGKCDLKRVTEASKKALLPPLVILPTFSDKSSACAVEIEKEWQQSFINALNVCNLDCWRDFWLRCIYEYCVLCLNNDFTAFAENIAIALENRKFSPKAKLHALSFIKYIRDNTPKDNEEYVRLSSWYEKTLKDCVLDGTLSSPEADGDPLELMREAAYTSEYAERKSQEKNKTGEYRIDHAKNRYTLCAVLSGHAKRGHKHMWETVLSIRRTDGALPRFQNIKVNERRHTVHRGGATLEHEKKRSQIICDGEILLNGTVSPFVLDLILDISYVSTTKCENLEIKIKQAHKCADSTVLNCQLFLY